MWPWRRNPREASLGRRGEKIARRHLRRLGMKILAANYRCPAGEADLIALAPPADDSAAEGTVVFVEVKTRSSRQYADPEAAVNKAKQRQVRRVAMYYLSSRDTRAFDLRFDVVAIVLPPGGEPEINHIPAAF